MKTKNKNQLLKVSDSTIEFIKKYLIKEMEITKPIDDDMLSEIVSYCDDYDQMLAQKKIEPSLVIKDEQKCFEAGNLVSDISGIWANNDVDLDDLNQRLDL